MKSVTRKDIMYQARQLYCDTSEETNPEYLRGMCELIAMCFQEPLEYDVESDIEDIKMDILIGEV